MFDPDAHMPRINRGMVYLGACLIAGIRLARAVLSFWDGLNPAPSNQLILKQILLHYPR
jgi:hypothetical protein